MSIGAAERLTDDELGGNPRAMGAEAELARLRALVEELAVALDKANCSSTHHPSCRAAKPGHDIPGRCDCWKADARVAIAKAEQERTTP